MEEKSEIQEDLGNGGKFKNWLQDNIRIVLSVLIVATIAAGIYSYSKRTVVPVGEIDNGTEVNLAEADIDDENNDGNNAVVVVGEEDQEHKTEKVDDGLTEKLSVEQADDDVDKATDLENKRETEKQQIAQIEEVVEEEVAREIEEVEVKVETEKVDEEQKNEEGSSEETEVSFVETADHGDSLTTLARRATKHYLEKNPTEDLSAEHKIYIEDYLRKQVSHSAIVYPGEGISFSKDLISQAISASKGLTENQLKNLQKYSSRVSGL